MSEQKLLGADSCGRVSVQSEYKVECLTKELQIMFKESGITECYRVKSTHSKWYEINWDDFLFVEDNDACFLHLGYSD